ncbi:hypothetical protein BG004_006625 [Podila humilis]|nr:hypothetical protein BG004_006625 [Podila humilis]
MALSFPTWTFVKRILEQLAVNQSKRRRTSLEYLILATLGCVLVAALKYPNRAILTKSRPDLKARKVDAPGWPIVGNLVDLLRHHEDPLQMLHQTLDERGDLVSMTLPGVGRILIVNNPKFMEHILKTNFDNYIKGDFFRGLLSDILGRGIFVSDKQEWRFHRKTASNIFTTRLYRSLVEGAFKDSANDFMRYCLQQQQQQPSTTTVTTNKSVTVDLQAQFLKLTLDAFGKLTFGLEFKALSQPGPNEFGDAFDYLTTTADTRILNPFWFITDRIMFWKHREKKRAIGVLHKWAAQAVQSRRAETALEKESRPKDLLDHFINYRNDEDGSMLEDDNLHEIFVNFMIAGRDTTAQALTWQFYALMSNPHVMANIVKEIDTVLSNDGDDHAMQGEGKKSRITYEVLMQELPYTKAVFHETLRLHPSVPKNVKQAVDDDILPDGTRVYAGEFVGYSNWCMGRNKRVWGEDADLFKPERWLLPVEGKVAAAGNDVKITEGGVSPFGKFKPESQFKFVSFNAGPRLCLGSTFATLEAMVTTCILLQKYEFKLSPGHPVPQVKGSVTLPMKVGLMAILAEPPHSPACTTMFEAADYQGLVDKINKFKHHRLNHDSACLRSPSSHCNILNIGDQSSGKSSVLKAFTKLPFPPDKGMCTRFATQVNLCCDLTQTQDTLLARIDGEDEFKERYKVVETDQFNASSQAALYR